MTSEQFEMLTQQFKAINESLQGIQKELEIRNESNRAGEKLAKESLDAMLKSRGINL